MISPMPVRITGFFGSREAYMRYMSYVEAKFQKSFAIDASLEEIRMLEISLYIPPDTAKPL